MISISYNSYLYITTFTFDKCCMEKKKEKKDLSREQDKMADILTCYMIVSRRIEQSPSPHPSPSFTPSFPSFQRRSQYQRHDFTLLSEQVEQSEQSAQESKLHREQLSR